MVPSPPPREKGIFHGDPPEKPAPPRQGSSRKGFRKKKGFSPIFLLPPFHRLNIINESTDHTKKRKGEAK
nr:hypothetical protein [Bacillaceae bacterium]